MSNILDNAKLMLNSAITKAHTKLLTDISEASKTILSSGQAKMLEITPMLKTAITQYVTTELTILINQAPLPLNIKTAIAGTVSTVVTQAVDKGIDDIESGSTKTIEQLYTSVTQKALDLLNKQNASALAG